jgi:ubiquinone/menaquinone biosynthesis C-methylase UbiE
MRRELASLARMLRNVVLFFYFPLVAVPSLVYFPWSTDPSLDRPLPAVRPEAQQFYQDAYLPKKNDASADSTSYIETGERAAEITGTRLGVQRFIDTYRLHDKRILDVGSGSGALQDLVRDYTGLDIAANLARYYHKPFIVGSATAMPFPDNSFDAVWTIWVLEHVPEPERMLMEIRRVLKPNGLLYLRPAWTVPPWVPQGYEVRPYRDLSLLGKVVKTTIPIQKIVLPLSLHPIGLIREAHYRIMGPRTRLRFRALKPNYDQYWGPDSDAAVSIDPTEAYLWFRSRGDECLERDRVFRVNKNTNPH